MNKQNKYPIFQMQIITLQAPCPPQKVQYLIMFYSRTKQSAREETAQKWDPMISSATEALILGCWNLICFLSNTLSLFMTVNPTLEIKNTNNVFVNLSEVESTRDRYFQYGILSMVAIFTIKNSNSAHPKFQWSSPDN